MVLLFSMYLLYGVNYILYFLTSVGHCISPCRFNFSISFYVFVRYATCIAYITTLILLNNLNLKNKNEINVKNKNMQTFYKI